ncbi:dr1-associated corepressor [Megalops cyprinoides]|uniref:dr1-associated corepressor n=1 Tax=Megalops cyprinoides TaxID=118141 RepID=UPI001863F0E0|nr:dr1-associated corepressor [Megalops cyprinoides]
MPGPKRKYSVRFPPGRIKKIMQRDTEVGRIAAAVPVIISRALEMFLKSLLTKTSQVTQSKHSRVISVAHMKQCIETEKVFDFLRDLVEQASAQSSLGKGKWPAHRKKWQDISINAKQHEAAERMKRPQNDSLDAAELSDVGICFEDELGS